MDPESPGRFELLERLYGPEAIQLILPAYRPQDIFQLHACEAMIRTVNRLADSGDTGAPIQLAVLSGDNTDNVQWNELRTFIGLLGGETVSSGSGGPAYEGVAAAEWNDAAYWHPDRFPDDYKSRWGFPEYPGALEEAVRPFQAEGMKHAWLSLLGNHDMLIIGTALRTPAFERILTGDRKAWAHDPVFDPLAHLHRFIEEPELYLAGETRPVTPDAARRTFDRHEYVEAHLRAGGSPQGHGFTAWNLDTETCYYVRDDFSRLRIIALDTNNPAGHYKGSVGMRQLRWLEERLIEAHARYFDATGSAVTTGNDDRLIVVLLHHGLASLNSPLDPNEGHDPERDDLPRVLGPEVESLLHRFPNVILLVNGHTHRNAIRARPDGEGRTAGFWEITTSSLSDWPCQGRTVEIVDNGNGTLSILTAMVDHDAPLDPREADGPDRLASIHRELAANAPHLGLTGRLAGEPSDRTTELLLPAPFPL